MRLLDSISLLYEGEDRVIELYHGDVLELSQQPVDCLVVSAFPDDYAPVPGTLIGALHRAGISLAQLATDKEADHREFASCWWTRDLRSKHPSSPAARILCFEPRRRGKAAEVIDDLIQCLESMVFEKRSGRRVAMPLVATGNQAERVSDVLPPLLEAAVQRLEMGLPVSRLMVLESNAEKAAEMKGAFGVIKKQILGDTPFRRPVYDFFVSYSHQNNEAADILFKELQLRRPGIRIFLDRQVFTPGVAWSQDLFEAIEHCRRVVPVLSPAYLASRMCRAEFHAAYLRQIQCGKSKPLLLPVYLHRAPLPNYMKTIQFIDCREGDPRKLRAAGAKLLTGL